MLLAARLRRLIDEGELPPGEPLPPDRALAAALAVGRSTVVAAYDLLRQDERISCVGPAAGPEAFVTGRSWMTPSSLTFSLTTSFPISVRRL
ncbi:MAG TPA: GntR family transcriptional regulator, partial [Streptosporangiaceae bacterium]|nr:GntR family transcriptional regulator [Streptosporangiaceae bacterium]